MFDSICYIYSIRYLSFRLQLFSHARMRARTLEHMSNAHPISYANRVYRKWNTCNSLQGCRTHGAYVNSYESIFHRWKYRFGCKFLNLVHRNFITYINERHLHSTWLGMASNLFFFFFFWFLSAAWRMTFNCIVKSTPSFPYGISGCLPLEAQSIANSV